MARTTPTATRTDVVIVGAGIVGAAAAHYLAREGKSVALLEKGTVANEQSSRNWGWVRQNGRNLKELPLGILSRTLWEGLEGDLGEPLGWAQQGNIDIASTSDELEYFRRWQLGARAIGLETEILSEGEVREMAAGLTGPIAGGIFSAADGQADPHRVAPAFARSAGRLGAFVHERVAVERVLVADGRVTGVRTDAGDFLAPAVIIAAGAWSTRLLWKLGIKLPQRPIRNTVLATTPAPPLTRTVLWAEGCAIRQDDTGRFILSGGGPSDTDVGLDLARFPRQFGGAMLDARKRGQLKLHAGRHTAADLRTGVRHTARYEHPWKYVRNDEPVPNLGNAWRTFDTFRALFPSIDGIGVERVWAGHIDYTPDAVPVLERLSQPEGLVIATGFSGHGFALGPGGGRVAAQLATGVQPSIDMAAFRLSRFAERRTHSGELHF
ncbi:MAG: NAD(P)/FAD-dependent oxidoreductase [Dehalococcoidia bacterium]